MFLVGKGIPDHITSLPETVLNTPFGQMLKPQLDNAMRGITQAPVPSQGVPQTSNQSVGTSSTHLNGSASAADGSSDRGKQESPGTVYNVTQLRVLDEHLTAARSKCAVIFFTSSTCAPCKIVYPAYDELAAEIGHKATLIKVDLNQAYEIGARYQVRATPTFMTFLKGEKENEWSGANESQLRGNVRLLVQMANPAHPHTNLRLPTLSKPQRPIIYAKIPPLEKLIAKLGVLSTDPSVTALKEFITARASSLAASAPIPSPSTLSTFICSALPTTPPDSLFPLIDLFRLAFIDPRMTGYFAVEPSHTTTLTILSHINDLATKDQCPYPLRIVTLQLSCNFFSSPLFPPTLSDHLALCDALVSLLTSSLLDTAHPPIRVAAASLALNLASANLAARRDQGADLFPISAQVEIVAGLLVTIEKEEESREALHGLVRALGLFAYLGDREGEVADLLRAMDAPGLLEGKARGGKFKEEKALLEEVGKVVR